MADEAASPTRSYVVLEQMHFEDEPQSPYFVEIHRVSSRNAINALRQAFKELRRDGYASVDATLVVVPASMWRPTPVHATIRESVSVNAA